MPYKEILVDFYPIFIILLSISIVSFLVMLVATFISKINGVDLKHDSCGTVFIFYFFKALMIAFLILPILFFLVISISKLLTMLVELVS